MKCPYCDNDMTLGHIPFNSPLILKWVSGKKKEKIRISDKIKWTEVSKIKNVYFCESCKIFIKKM